MPEIVAECPQLAARELARGEAGRESVDLMLNRIAALIANHFEGDVGSIYQLQEDGQHLLLVATVGLLQTCVGRLRMSLHEGLVGLVAQHRRPLALAEAPLHPRFKFFPEADEEQYHSFLGVPIESGGVVCGVLVVQTIEPREFSQSETEQLSRVASLLGPALAQADEVLGAGRGAVRHSK
jgi:phosphotransferase system enzyme I (PtsP)